MMKEYKMNWRFNSIYINKELYDMLLFNDDFEKVEVVKKEGRSWENSWFVSNKIQRLG